MLYELLRFGHLIGLILIGAGLIGVFLSDIRTRQAKTLPVFAEAVRNIALFYDGLVVPGALLLLGSGTWLIIEFYDGWAFLELPWLAGMVLLFAFEFVEGNTITRLYFMKLRRLSIEALRQGHFTAELEQARGTGADVHALPGSAHPVADRLARRAAPGYLDALSRRLGCSHCRGKHSDRGAPAALHL
jgi:hypothetical protein